MPPANDVVLENGNDIDTENVLNHPVTQLENQSNGSETSVEVTKENNCSNMPNIAENQISIANHSDEPMMIDNHEAPYPYSYSMKRRFEDDDTSSNAEKKFNEDVLCSHGE